MTYQATRDPRKGECRALTCKAQLLWAETPKGKRIPLNPTPSEEGNIAVEPRPGRTLDLAVVLDAEHLRMARANGDALYTVHHATCPARNAFKRAKAK